MVNDRKPRKNMLTLRMTDDERDLLDQEARKLGLPVGILVRRRLGWDDSIKNNTPKKYINYNYAND